MGGGMAIGGIPMVGGGAGVVVLIVFVLLQLLGGGIGGGGGTGGYGNALDPFGGAAPVAPGQDVDLTNQGDQVEFIGYVLDDANELWAHLFSRAGRQYEATTLVLFTGSTQSGCGSATSRTGLFYCPLDRKVYVDLEFFDDLHRRFGAPGDFAQAYVIAHEVAHHVQTLLGISEQVRAEQQANLARANELSVALELQADCLAGVWAQAVFEQGDLEAGDLEEGLNAAAAVGDDRIQESVGADVNPETWTHGSAEQRQTCRGRDTADPAACDTFGG